MNSAGLILAAGRSSRMGRDKALLVYRGKTFLNHLVHLALPRVESIVVVLGHNEQVISESLPDSQRIKIVVNRDYDRGMLSSLQQGLESLAASVDWILWMLVDHPAVRGRTLDALIASASRTDAPLVIPRFDGNRGHPIMVSRRVAERMLQIDPTASPQDVVRSHYGETRFIDVKDPGIMRDIDRPIDYRDLQETD